ncbi:conjugal transfer protein TraC [Agrobacterium sp. 22-226-1]
MKKPASRIRDEIARLQEQLRAAETRQAERIGKIALKAGLGEIEIDEAELQSAFEQLAERFREGEGAGRTGAGGGGGQAPAATLPSRADAGSNGEV